MLLTSPGTRGFHMQAYFIIMTILWSRFCHYPNLHVRKLWNREAEDFGKGHRLIYALQKMLSRKCWTVSNYGYYRCLSILFIYSQFSTPLVNELCGRCHASSLKGEIFSGQMIAVQSLINFKSGLLFHVWDNPVLRVRYYQQRACHYKQYWVMSGL